MTAPLLLIAYAIIAATVATRLMSTASWTSRSPAWGIVAWQALTGSIVSSVVLAGAALALPAVPFSTDLAALLRACTLALREQYSTPGGAAASATGAVLAVTVLVRIVYCLVAGLLAAARARRDQLERLALVARRDHGSGALIVEHPAAVAYCLPGRRHEVVLTTAALAALDQRQLSAVLAHERAHLAGRHDLVLATITAFERSFPRVKAFQLARSETARLVEMLADDIACRDGDRMTMATALVHMAEGATPAAALGVGGETAVVRVRRLVRPASPLGRGRSMVVALSAGALLVGPAVVVAAPAMVATLADYCPITL